MATVAEATSALESAQARFDTSLEEAIKAGKKGDLELVLTSAQEVATSKALLERAKSAVTSAEFEEKASERLVASSTAIAAIKTLVAENPIFDTAFGLGITYFTIAPGSNGSVNVSAMQKTMGKGPSTPKAPSAGGDGTRTRHIVTWNGTEYGTRSFLEAVVAAGGEDGEFAAKALDRDTNWATYGKARPGIHQAVLAMVKAKGASMD